MNIENTLVYGFEKALKAMRNPFDSWDKSDTTYSKNFTCKYNDIEVPENPQIGPNDMRLARKLIKNGSEHRKFMRLIVIYTDITIPRYLWQELDTYKISTVRNSCSTMHKLGHYDLTKHDFMYGKILDENLNLLNKLGEEYRKTKNYDLVREMKCYLPESYLQKSTYFMNYETAINMYYQRKSHKLAEWNLKNTGVYSICKWIEDLPYMKGWLT